MGGGRNLFGDIPGDLGRRVPAPSASAPSANLNRIVPIHHCSGLCMAPPGHRRERHLPTPFGQIWAVPDALAHLGYPQARDAIVQAH